MHAAVTEFTNAQYYCVCAFVSFRRASVCIFSEGAESARQAFLNGAPQIIHKFTACIENQGISPSRRVQVLSGFLLKRCSGIRNGRGALSLLSLMRSLRSHPGGEGVTLWREVLLHFRQSRQEHSMNR